MDLLLGKVTSQAMNYAIRSGITITTTYAIKQCGRLLKEAPRSEAREELMHLQLRLESKIRIISPAIDMIELISARGNTSLESAVTLTKEIRYEIQRLGTRLSDAANDEQVMKKKPHHVNANVEREGQLRRIVSEIKQLLLKIEDAVPLINLAITTSGVNLSTKLSGTISPSRLLQASTFLTAADSKYAAQLGNRVQVGPIYTLSLYMLFAGHAWRPVDQDGVREMTWKEVIHKAKVKLMRVPLEDLDELPGNGVKTIHGGFVADSIPSESKTGEFAYQLLLIEDLDDGRVHTFEDENQQPGPFEDVASAGIRDVLPVHEISKVFYADTGKILNIGGEDEGNNPVLLLKRDVNADPPRRMLHRSQMGDGGWYDDSVLEETQAEDHNDQQRDVNAQLHHETLSNAGSPARNQNIPDPRRLPANLDPEWMAFEVYVEEPDSEDDLEDTSEEISRPTSRRADSPATSLTGALSKLNFRSSTPSNSPNPNRHQPHSPPSPTRPAPQIKTSLSLLEMLLKLATLQQFRQESHLAIEDELLNFFLEDSATAGAGPDKGYRQRLRNDAVRRVGFDPYDESPIKRRGEIYIDLARGVASPRPSFDPGAFVGAMGTEQYGSPGLSSPDGSVYPSVEQDNGVMPSSPSPMGLLSSDSPQMTTGGPARSKSQLPLLATPPSSNGPSRQAYTRTQSLPKVGSPLVRSDA